MRWRKRSEQLALSACQIDREDFAWHLATADRQGFAVQCPLHRNTSGLGIRNNQRSSRGEGIERNLSFRILSCHLLAVGRYTTAIGDTHPFWSDGSRRALFNALQPQPQAMVTSGGAPLQNMSGIRHETSLVNLNVPARDCPRLTCAGWKLDQATSSGSMERQYPLPIRR
jgi:hypothetical protein